MFFSDSGIFRGLPRRLHVGFLNFCLGLLEDAFWEGIKPLPKHIYICFCGLGGSSKIFIFSLKFELKKNVLMRIWRLQKISGGHQTIHIYVLVRFYEIYYPYFSASFWPRFWHPFWPPLSLLKGASKNLIDLPPAANGGPRIEKSNSNSVNCSMGWGKGPRKHIYIYMFCAPRPTPNQAPGFPGGASKQASKQASK